MSRRAVIRGALGVAALGVLGTTRRASSRRDVPDYVVVGGGVYGTGLAGELARHGAGVLVLEARRIASGASGGLGQRGVRSNGRQASELPIMMADWLVEGRRPDLLQPFGLARLGIG